VKNWGELTLKGHKDSRFAMYFWRMIEIEGKIVALDVFEKQFVCDLTKCKGACCVGGDSGAPLTLEELETIDRDLEKIRPFLRPEGLAAIDAYGVAVIDQEGELTTTLVNGKECAFVVFDEKGTALCGIEHAHKAGATDFLKPISCHLYPIRITNYPTFEAVNYDKWDVCNPACKLGEALQVPVYQFLKNSLVRKYGADWFAQLEAAAALLQKTQ
jgi:hypothetical protein